MFRVLSPPPLSLRARMRLKSLFKSKYKPKDEDKLLQWTTKMQERVLRLREKAAALEESLQRRFHRMKEMPKKAMDIIVEDAHALASLLKDCAKSMRLLMHRVWERMTESFLFWLIVYFLCGILLVICLAVFLSVWPLVVLCQDVLLPLFRAFLKLVKNWRAVP
ncbi:hypothetical protein AX16_003265 [Volvariella volvacea WC 439]|nr:hypothetical protein AX16_003265 [Volvariella volvacea WC 439]